MTRTDHTISGVTSYLFVRTSHGGTHRWRREINIAPIKNNIGSSGLPQSPVFSIIAVTPCTHLSILPFLSRRLAFLVPCVEKTWIWQTEKINSHSKGQLPSCFKCTTLLLRNISGLLLSCWDPQYILWILQLENVKARENMLIIWYDIICLFSWRAE